MFPPIYDHKHILMACTNARARVRALRACFNVNLILAVIRKLMSLLHSAFIDSGQRPFQTFHTKLCNLNCYRLNLHFEV